MVPFVTTDLGLGRHASYHGGGRRRMFTINCLQRFPEDRLDDLKVYLSSAARFWRTRIYGERMVASADARRWVHLEQCWANDGELAGLAEEARARDGQEPSRG